MSFYSGADFIKDHFRAIEPAQSPATEPLNFYTYMQNLTMNGIDYVQFYVSGGGYPVLGLLTSSPVPDNDRYEFVIEKEGMAYLRTSGDISTSCDVRPFRFFKSLFPA